MKTLLIDNYDSFTFNLFQLIAEVNGIEPVVFRNNDVELGRLDLADFDNLVLSPGPGRPDHARDFGICTDLIAHGGLPILGVCLGHQGICQFFGGSIDYAPTVMHGQTSPIHHTGTSLFRGIPSPFDGMRYHSLYVNTLPDSLRRTAWTEDGIVMAAEHREQPIFGVQFHPESVATEFAHRLLDNFRTQTVERIGSPSRRRDRERTPSKKSAAPPPAVPHPVAALTLYRRHLSSHPLAPERIFRACFGSSKAAFWIDRESANHDEDPTRRFSVMGDATGPHAEVIDYRIAERRLRVTSANSDQIVETAFFDWLNHELQARSRPKDNLRFPFNAGFVGYLGYELKAESGGNEAHPSPTPDAAFIFSDRFVIYDHQTSEIELICLDDEEHANRAEGWFDEIGHALDSCLEKRDDEIAHPPAASEIASVDASTIQYRHGREQYLERIREAQREIKAGESYEVCLTNMASFAFEGDPLTVFLELRRINPAPYASYLSLRDTAIVSLSPERFLTIDAGGHVEARPIKGTRRRGKDSEADALQIEGLRSDQKERAENIMIVNLVRNDLGSVCEVGSVNVPTIFEVETHPTVLQLVSTVRGTLRPECSSVDCVRAAFPGGSMTGAPKKRTMEILDRLEEGPRGAYSGALGLFSLSGAIDLGIVIRTLVVDEHGTATVGFGGAIVDRSSPVAELEEAEAKANVILSPLIAEISDGTNQ